MADLTDITNLTGVNVTQLIDWTPILEKLKLIANIGLIILAAYIIYRIIKFIFARIRERRIKKTYENTKLILEKLDKIEKKLDMREKPEKIKVKEKKLKKKKKKSK
jgi:hypothetical protein